MALPVNVVGVEIVPPQLVIVPEFVMKNRPVIELPDRFVIVLAVGELVMPSVIRFPFGPLTNVAPFRLNRIFTPRLMVPAL